MKNSKKISALLLGTALVLGGLTACADTDSGNAKSAGSAESTGGTESTGSVAEQGKETFKKLNIGAAGSDDSVAMEIANLAYNNGYLEEELNAVGYTANIVAFQGAGPEINEALAAGDINAAVYGDFPAFTSKSNGIDTTVVATVNKKQQFGVLATGDITSAKDLEGKKVIVLTGTTAQYYWEHYVAAYDIDVDAVEIINATDATSLLSTGEADAYVMTLPSLVYFEGLGIGNVLDDSTKVEDGHTSYLFEVASSVLEEDPEVGVAINKALIRAYEDAVANPQDLYDAVASAQIGADCYEAQYAFDTSLVYLLPEITDESLAYYENLNEWLINHSLISEAVDIDSFFDTSYYQKAVDELAE